MIRVVAPPQDEDAQWVEWNERTRRAAEELERTYKAGGKLTFTDLYLGQRQTLLRLFHDKCAYCESRVIADQHSGDVDHFRPKGRVKDAGGKLVCSLNGGAERQHPGYYWLAYDWSNLLPSCAGCNRPGKSPGGESRGKWDRFPVAGLHAWTRDELASESPLLVNPRVDDPEEHLQFDDELGMIGWKTEKGAATVKLLDLNRDGLPERRRITYERAYAAFVNYIATVRERIREGQPISDRKVQGYANDLLNFKEGCAEYSAVGQAAIRSAKSHDDTAHAAAAQFS